MKIETAATELFHYLARRVARSDDPHAETFDVESEARILAGLCAFSGISPEPVVCNGWLVEWLQSGIEGTTGPARAVPHLAVCLAGTGEADVTRI